MFNRSISNFNFQRGSWVPGSKHQKHMTMNPTEYLYRFPGKNGPGPFTMKYLWTLGCFPTGLTTPFRLHEFLAYYQQQHVPQEVEEWLQCFVLNPVEILEENLEKLINQIEAMPAAEVARGYTAHMPSISSLKPSLHRVEEQLGISLPLLGVRSALSNSKSRGLIYNDLWSYQEAIREHGSTPHRRLARLWLETPLETEEMRQLPTVNDATKDSISLETSSMVNSVTSLPENTADDERHLIRLCTTIAEECIVKKHYEDAYALSESLLTFSHDLETNAIVQANTASAAIMNGLFSDGAYYAKEAALYEPAARTANDVSHRGYCLWTVALAYQDEYETALGILENALALYCNDKTLSQLQSSVLCLKKEYSKTSPALRKGLRSFLSSQRDRGLLNGTGVYFDNPFDSIVFNGKTYVSKMNPSTNEMGSVFRRVGISSSHIATSYSMESI